MYVHSFFQLHQSLPVVPMGVCILLLLLCGAAHSLPNFFEGEIVLEKETSTDRLIVTVEYDTKIYEVFTPNGGTVIKNKSLRSKRNIFESIKKVFFLCITLK